MNNLYRTALFTWLIVMTSLIGTPAHAENDSSPDSIHTKGYIEKISITEPHRALKLIDEMEAYQQLPQFRLDKLRSIVYQNGLNMFRMALTYSLKAYRNDSIHRHPDEALALLELITDQYNVTGNYTESTRLSVEGIELAKQTGNKRSEANLLLYLGINKWFMGLKDEADEYVEQAIQMQEQVVGESREWGPVDDLIYIYGMKITFAIEDKKYQKAIDLLPRYEKLMEQLSACPDLPDGICDMRWASAYASYAYIFVTNGQPDKAAEFYRKFEETDYASTDDGNQMRFDYLIATGRYREALQYIHHNNQLYQAQGDTINYIYIEQNLGQEAQAYTGMGDYQSAARVYRQMYVLSDSLRIREKQNGVLEFATIYETKEKEAQLMQQASQLRDSRMIQIFAACIIGLLGILLWRNIRHTRIVKAKNEVMVGTIENLLGYKDELFRRKEENLMLKEQLQAAEGELQNREGGEVASAEEESSAEEGDNETIANGQALFDKAEREIINHRLYLQPNFSRAELMKRVRIPKNKFALLFKQYANAGFLQYINNLRLEYAARMLKEHPEYAVEAIAGECGIPNKQTFYRLFLEQYGMTPAEYRMSKKRSVND